MATPTIINATCDVCGNGMRIMRFGKVQANRPKRRCLDCRIDEESRREAQEGR